MEIGNNIDIANNVGLIGKYDHDYSKVGVSIKDAPWIGDDSYDLKEKIRRSSLKMMFGSDLAQLCLLV